MTTLPLAMVLAEAARRHPDAVAVVDGGTQVTYAELWREARCHAARLRQLGVRPGDQVTLMVGNVVDFPRAYYGILAAGAVVVPVHLLLTADEAAQVLRDSRAGLLVCQTELLPVGGPAATSAGIPLVGVGAGEIPAGTPVSGLVRMELPRCADHVRRTAGGGPGR